MDFVDIVGEVDGFTELCKGMRNAFKWTGRRRVCWFFCIMETAENHSVSVNESVSGKNKSLRNLKPFKKGSDERRELARMAKRPTMKIGDALKKLLDRRVDKVWLKKVFGDKWEPMEKLLTDKPRIGEVLAVRMVVGAMTDAYLLDMLLNRTDGKVVQPVAGAFGAVIRVELPPEAMKGPAPEVLDCEFKPEGEKMDGVDIVDDVD